MDGKSKGPNTVGSVVPSGPDNVLSDLDPKNVTAFVENS